VATVPEIVDVEHVGLSVHDLDAMTDWYVSALGMRVEDHFASDEFRVRVNVVRGPGALRIELVERPGSHPNPEHQHVDSATALMQEGYGHLALRVRSVEQAFAVLVAAGAEPLFGPRPSFIREHRMAYVMDPEGNHIELLSYA